VAATLLVATLTNTIRQKYPSIPQWITMFNLQKMSKKYIYCKSDKMYNVYMLNNVTSCMQIS
jgi:hypothetical protein